MAGLHERFRRNDAQVIAKVMDGEAVIINLANGMYYSSEGTGSAVWTLIESGCSLAEMVRWLTDAFDVGTATAQEDLARLIDELVSEELIVAVPEDGAGAAAPPRAPQPRRPYTAPVLHIYRDMGDLLALDPPIPALRDLPWKDDGSTH